MTPFTRFLLVFAAVVLVVCFVGGGPIPGLGFFGTVLGMGFGLVVSIVGAVFGLIVGALGLMIGIVATIPLAIPLVILLSPLILVIGLVVLATRTARN